MEILQESGPVIANEVADRMLSTSVDATGMR
jgi:hypothetical protein